MSTNSFKISASEDTTARLWDSEGKLLAVLAGHTEIPLLGFSPDGSRILTRAGDGSARLWDSQGKPLAVIGGFDAKFSPDGSRILTRSDDNTALLYRVPAATDDRSTGPAASR